MTAGPGLDSISPHSSRSLLRSAVYMEMFCLTWYPELSWSGMSGPSPGESLLSSTETLVMDGKLCIRFSLTWLSAGNCVVVPVRGVRSGLSTGSSRMPVV